MSYVKKTPLEGDLQEVWLPHIFIKILIMNLTGILLLELEDRQCEIYFRKGQVVHIKSNHKDDRFGQFLVKIGVLQEIDVEAVLEKQKQFPQLKFGDILIKEQMVEPHLMLKYLNEHHTERLYYVFEHKAGSYRYVKNSQWSEEVSIFEIPTHRIYFEAIERFYSLEEIKQYIELTDKSFVQKNNVHRIDFPLPPLPSKVLYSVQDTTEVNVLIKKIGQAKEKVYPVLFVLVIANWLEMVSDAQGSRKIHSGKKVSELAKRQIDIEYPKFLKKNYFEMFSVPLQLNPQKVQTNFFNLMKQYAKYEGTEKGDQILQWIKVGYQVLLNKKLRVHYIKRLKILDGNRDKLMDDRTFFHGLYLLNKDNIDQAKRKFEQVNNKHPKDGLYRSYFLATQYELESNKENLQDAMKEFEERQNLVRSEPYLAFVYANMLIRTKKTDKAEKILENMIEREQGYLPAQKLLDEIRFERAKENKEKVKANKAPESALKKLLFTNIGGSKDHEEELSDEYENEEADAEEE